MHVPAQVSMITKGAALAAIGCVLSTTTAHAAGFTSIRIGDVDGFGYGNGAGYNAANGSSVNVDGQGPLSNGDFLPDLNENGIFATYQGDDFDNRTDAENSNVQLTGSGFRDNGSNGSQFTDLSLSTSFLDTLAGVTPLTEQRNALGVQRQGTQTQLNELNQQIRPIQEQLSTLWPERQAFAKQRDVVQGKINQVYSQIKALREQGRAQNASQINDLVAEKDNLIVQKTELQGQIDAVKAQIDTLKNEQTPLVDQRQELLTQKEGIETNVDTLSQEIEQLRAEHSLVDSKIPQPVFTFDFSVDQGNIVEDSPLYFNLLFADYDVKDAEIQFTTANGSFTRQLTKQRNANGFDGWVQSAFVELGFDEVFTATEDGFDGLVTAEIIAKNEPYLAFDFAELSASQISIDADDNVASVPEPVTTFGLLVFGAVSTCALKKRN